MIGYAYAKTSNVRQSRSFGLFSHCANAPFSISQPFEISCAPSLSARTEGKAAWFNRQDIDVTGLILTIDLVACCVVIASRALRVIYKHKLSPAVLDVTFAPTLST